VAVQRITSESRKLPKFYQKNQFTTTLRVGTLCKAWPLRFHFSCDSTGINIAISEKPIKFRPVYPTEAIVIRLTRLTETSLIVHWFTESHGLVKTVAKGARRAKSPFAGQLDLFFGGEITFSPARVGELHSLREVAIHHWREGLRLRYSSTLLAAYCCQLVESAVEPEHSEPGLFDLLKRALDHLGTQPPSLRALHHFEAELAKQLGVFDHQSKAEASLRDALSLLPSSRGELIERLSSMDGFSSSAGKIHE
jgi:DNA repair protein RecO (recombination protein O)